MEQDVDLNDATRDPTSSSIVSHFFLMAKDSMVSPTLSPNISHDDDVDDNEDQDNDEESDNIASLKIKGGMIFKSIYNNNIVRSNFMEIMPIAAEGKKYVEELEAHIEEHEATFETMEGHGRDYAGEIVELSQALENEQTTKESLEETFSLELSRLKESHDSALELPDECDWVMWIDPPPTERVARAFEERHAGLEKSWLKAHDLERRVIYLTEKNKKLKMKKRNELMQAWGFIIVLGILLGSLL
ncbi:hypothetical protein D1007_24863 [Hordeum vulgare]|nr:hypothetical protein D1007_24863 [Hordeum vulgare]